MSQGTLDRDFLTGRDAPGIARDEFGWFATGLGERIASTGALLISELVTNAVLHGPAAASSVIGLRCSIAGARLHVEIADDGDGFVPRARSEGQDPVSGWGLHVVNALSDAWGVGRGRPTRVWFELAL